MCQGRNDTTGRSVVFCSLLDHLKLQIIKVDGFDKTVFRKPRLIMQLKIADIGIEPDRLA